MQSMRALRPRLGRGTAQNGVSSLLRFSASATRSIHRVPALPYQEKWSRDGIEGFMSPMGFDLAWTQTQHWLVDNLNRLTEGTEYNDSKCSPKDIALMTARNPNQAQIFNYASMAYNNHFFFHCLTDEPEPLDANFADIIAESCSSVDSLREEMLGIAEVMFGPGFVWLCKDETGSLKLLNTYIAGTPFAAAHFRAQSIDANTTRAEDLPVSASANPLHKNPTMSPRVRPMMGRASSASAAAGRQSAVAPGGIYLEPLLCVNTWQSVWLPDFDLRDKRSYLEKWWDHIDWKQVVKNYGPFRSRPGPSSYQNIH